MNNQAADKISLSIVIPVYNWDIAQLLDALTAEIAGIGFDRYIEIIIADDCSDESYRNVNRKKAQPFDRVAYHDMANRLGRAAVRNFLAKKAAGDYILFLDADMLPDNRTFLSNYLHSISQGYKIICGGISYRQRILHDGIYDFSVYKGKKTEWLAAQKRAAVPWRYLFTSNVLIHRSVLDEVRFDEKFSAYGYEDIEWGIRLAQQFTIQHVDNTCSHLGLVPKDLVFERMHQSIPNFLWLSRLHPTAFQETGVAGFIRIIQKIDRSFLEKFDAVCCKLFYMLNNSKLLYLLFQIDKVVLLALAMHSTLDTDRKA